MILIILYTVLLLFIIIRNNWVFNNRTRILKSDYKKYNKLLPYNDMLFRFWVWDVNKLIKDKK